MIGGMPNMRGSVLAMNAGTIRSATRGMAIRATRTLSCFDGASGQPVAMERSPVASNMVPNWVVSGFKERSK